jgi:hypothetical protein
MAVRKKTASKKTCTRKVKKLSGEALKLVDKKARLIATSLYDSTLAGNVVSARLLVHLAEGDADAEQAVSKGPVRSQALELAEEPEWQDETPEPVV